MKMMIKTFGKKTEDELFTIVYDALNGYDDVREALILEFESTAEKTPEEPTKNPGQLSSVFQEIFEDIIPPI